MGQSLELIGRQLAQGLEQKDEARMAPGLGHSTEHPYLIMGSLDFSICTTCWGSGA